MDDTIRIFCKNTQTYQEVPQGSSLNDILGFFPIDKPFPVLAARVNCVPAGLNMHLFTNKDVEFLDYRDMVGKRSYVHSLCFLLYTALKRLYPKSSLQIAHALSNGYYCLADIGHDIEDKDVALIKSEMDKLVADDIRYKRCEAHTQEVADLFRSQGLTEKANLFESSSSVYSTYYMLDDVIDSFYDILLPSTGYIRLFGLEKYKEGLLLRIPDQDDPSKLAPHCNQDKIFEAYTESREWNKKVHLSTMGGICEAIRKGYLNPLINVTEALQEKKLINIAERIANDEDIRMVLISGPSSSGKTTFSKRLSVQLMACAKVPCPISLDNYFVNRVDTPLDENGEYDFESLYALDLDLFNRDLKAIMNGEEIELPYYNFQTGKREYKGEKFRLRDGMILILEGTHGLNPELTKSIPDKYKYKIYVSALTSIGLDDHNWIPSTENRLLRRIIRDNSYRGFSAQETIRRWPSVRQGEDKWIFPFQEYANVVFNSALIYELGVLKSHVEPLLQSVPRNSDEYGESLRLMRFLENVPTLQDKVVPLTSLLREFLGGSSFKY